jgi:4-hydroxy-tetrahydrodipicolinate synthase
MFQGSIVALVTPMDEHNQVDEAGLYRLLDFQLDNGTSGIVVAGTTGESTALAPDEYASLLQQVAHHVDGRVPVIAGTGTASTERTVGTTQLAASLGADAALVVTPYYVRPTQAGLAAHYRAIADASPIPILLYNVPTRTGVDLLPATVAGLVDHPRIVGIKEAVALPERVHALVELASPEFVVLSGDDPSSMSAITQGARGVISVAANVAPKHLSDMCRAASQGDLQAAQRLQEQLGDLFSQLGLATNPIPVKWAAFAMGLVGPGIRLPLLPLDPSGRPGLVACLDALGLMPAN